MAMEIDNQLLLKSFEAETGEGLVQMEAALLELESHPDDMELVNTVFRVVHTFKGNAAIFELKYAQDFAHALEDLLDKIRNRQFSFSPDIADVLLASQDVLREFTKKAASGKVAAKPARSKTQPTKPAPAAVELLALSEEEEKPSSPQSSARTLRVDIEKLDRLLDLTGEIAIARGRTTRLLESREGLSIDELAEAHHTEGMLQAELQELVMKVRMVPVGPQFRQYQRTVRDLSRELGKTVNLQIEGDDVEVDTSVVEHLRDPLLHMIRNALDHGIELPEHRRKADKLPAATITLRASHQSGGICVEVEDDG